jgi:hypothetical protein
MHSGVDVTEEIGIFLYVLAAWVCGDDFSIHADGNADCSRLINFQSIRAADARLLNSDNFAHLQFYSIDQLVCRFIRTVIFYPFNMRS